jgi:hypothetical protein
LSRSKSKRLSKSNRYSLNNVCTDDSDKQTVEADKVR